jgi:hypothetical protein
MGEKYKVSVTVSRTFQPAQYRTLVLAATVERDVTADSESMIIESTMMELEGQLVETYLKIKERRGRDW